MASQGVTNWLLNIPYAGETPEQIQGNADAIQNWANQAPFLMMFAVGSPIFGPNFPDTNRAGGISTTPTFLAQASSLQVGFIAGSSNSVFYPRKFPNGLLALLPASSTNAGTAIIINIKAADTTSFQLSGQDVTGGITATLTVSYIAIGW